MDKLENQKKCLNEELITFQCTMDLQESVVELASNCKARTIVGADRSCFRWNVREIDSPIWKASKIFPCSSEVYFELILTAPEDTVEINVKKVTKINPAPHVVAIQLSLLDLNEGEQVSRRSKCLFRSNETWKFPSFLEKNILQDEKHKYVINGMFTLLCKFTVSNPEMLECIEGYSSKCFLSLNYSSDESRNTLSQDLKQMYIERLQTDVNLHAENQTFKTHKCVLSARSPVFAAMFSGDLLEKQSGVVDIPDVEAKILDYFLMFLYTGDVDILDYESASKLLIIADKYQVSTLKKKSSNFLMSNLSIMNVYDIVSLADMIGHNELITYSVNFIAAHADTILISDDWSGYIQNNIRLASDILRKLSVIIGTKMHK